MSTSESGMTPCCAGLRWIGEIYLAFCPSDGPMELDVNTLITQPERSHERWQ